MLTTEVATAYLKWSEDGSQVRFKRLRHQLRLLGDLRPVPIVIEHPLRSEIEPTGDGKNPDQRNTASLRVPLHCAKGTIQRGTILRMGPLKRRM